MSITHKLVSSAILAGAISMAIASPAHANWLVNGMRVAGVNGDYVSATSHRGSEIDNFNVNSDTVVQIEIPGTFSDVEVGKYIRLIAPDHRLAVGATEMSVRRIQILEISFKKNDDDAAAGYGRGFVDGVVTSLSPYLQIETPGGVTVTGYIANNADVITYHFGSLGDIVAGAAIDANLHADKSTNDPVADKVWVWRVDVI